MGTGEGEEHLGFDLEMLGAEVAIDEGRQVGEPVAALGIGKVGLGGGGKAVTEPAVGPAAEGGHGEGVIHAIADDETGSVGGGVEEVGGVFGSVLAIAIEQEDPGCAESKGLGPALGEGATLSGGRRVAEDDGAGVVGEEGGGIRGAVIDDDDGWGEGEEVADDGADGPCFVEAWNDGGGIRWRRIHEG